MHDDSQKHGTEELSCEFSAFSKRPLSECSAAFQLPLVSKPAAHGAGVSGEQKRRLPRVFLVCQTPDRSLWHKSGPRIAQDLQLPFDSHDEVH